MTRTASTRLTGPSREFYRDVIRGLSAAPKTLPCKYFYDATGSKLFEQICQLPEYYLTRVEFGIMERHVAEICGLLGTSCLIIEPGSGASTKTRLLLRQLQDVSGYVPIDVSAAALRESTAQLRREFPDVSVHPTVGDFAQPISLPRDYDGCRRVVYFPGSTIGNFDPRQATRLLAQLSEIAGESGAILIGVDLAKDAETIRAAYNDSRGVTAAFNKNILHRINREIGGRIPVERFAHRAVYRPDRMRVEMRLVSLDARRVKVGPREFGFEEGESICTEYSHKYTQEAFSSLVADAGLRLVQAWTDEFTPFSVQLLEKIR